MKQVSDRVSKIIETMIDKSGECWIWQGEMFAKFNKPYVKQKKRNIWIHRFMFEKYVQEIPKSGNIWRTCWNARCVNPKHLKLIMPGQTCPKRDGGDFKDLQTNHMASIREEVASARS